MASVAKTRKYKRLEALFRRWHEEDIARQQEYEESAVLVTLTDEQLCDVLLASYVSTRERVVRDLATMKKLLRTKRDDRFIVSLFVLCLLSTVQETSSCRVRRPLVSNNGEE